VNVPCALAGMWRTAGQQLTGTQHIKPCLSLSYLIRREVLILISKTNQAAGLDGLVQPLVSVWCPSNNNLAGFLCNGGQPSQRPLTHRDASFRIRALPLIYLIPPPDQKDKGHLFTVCKSIGIRQKTLDPTRISIDF